MFGRKGKLFSKGNLQQVANAMQLPVGAMPNTVHFEISGNREVVIEGSRGILHYEDTLIKINTGKMITVFKGRGLLAKCLTADALVVEGFITGIEFVS